MKRIALLVIILLSSIKGFAQSHPRDKEIEAAILAYLKEDTLTTYQGFKYVRTIDLNKKEYLKRCANGFNTNIFIAEHILKDNRESEKEYKARKEEFKNNPKLQSAYNDTLIQLSEQDQLAEKMLRANKKSLDSCSLLAKDADTIGNYAYMAYVHTAWTNKTSLGDYHVSKRIVRFLVTKALEVHLYLVQDEEEPLFSEE